MYFLLIFHKYMFQDIHQIMRQDWIGWFLRGVIHLLERSLFPHLSFCLPVCLCMYVCIYLYLYILLFLFLRRILTSKDIFMSKKILVNEENQTQWNNISRKIKTMEIYLHQSYCWVKISLSNILRALWECLRSWDPKADNLDKSFLTSWLMESVK